MVLVHRLIVGEGMVGKEDAVKVIEFVLDDAARKGVKAFFLGDEFESFWIEFEVGELDPFEPPNWAPDTGDGEATFHDGFVWIRPESFGVGGFGDFGIYEETDFGRVTAVV